LTRTRQQNIEHLKDILENDQGRFGNYQELPPLLFERIPELEQIGSYFRKATLPVDSPRYTWLREQLPDGLSSAIDIGANLGFFSLSLAAEYGIEATAYEQLGIYSEACEALADLAGLDDKVICRSGELIVDKLPEQLSVADLSIHLSVLHHAGEVFDVDTVKKMGGWRAYALETLHILGDKTSHLFFQTGNLLGGRPDLPVLFDGRETVPFIRQLLEDAGCTIEATGIVVEPETLKFATFGPQELDQAPSIWCRRDADSGLVAYFIGEECIGRLATGHAQRPLWFCKR